jgi:hypothetical protein
VWLVALGKIFTMDNLWKWRIIVVDRCCMCKRNEESIDHLLLHFEVVCAIWNFSQSIWVVLGFVCFLVDFQWHLVCCCVENSTFMPFLLSLEGNEL